MPNFISVGGDWKKPEHIQKPEPPKSRTKVEVKIVKEEKPKETISKPKLFGRKLKRRK